MRTHFAPRLFAALVASAQLAACGGNPTSGTSVLPGTAGAQSAARAVDSLPSGGAPAANAATPTPTPHPPCYCPPHQRICSDIACTVTNSTARSTESAVVPAAATPTPHPPCYCPPSRVPHACPDCAVTSLSIPGITAGDARVAALAPRHRYASSAA